MWAKALKIAKWKLDTSERFLFPLLLLWIRYFIGCIFFTSGKLKASNWEGTLMLFEYEHPVPYVPHEIAAVLGTGAELILPPMLFFGLGGRISAFGLFIMTVIIELTYLHVQEHIFWMTLLGVIILHGPGTLSIDHFIRKKYLKDTK